MSSHNTIIVDAGRLGSRWLTPGRVLRALHQAGRIPSGAVGTLQPLGLGRVEASVPTTLSLALMTPVPVRLDDGIVMIRRHDDPPALPGSEGLEARLDGVAASPGQLSATFSEALGDGFGAEDVGLTLVGGDRLLTELPSAAHQRLPERLTVEGAHIALDVGKKKP